VLTGDVNVVVLVPATEPVVVVVVTTVFVVARGSVVVVVVEPITVCNVDVVLSELVVSVVETRSRSVARKSSTYIQWFVWSFQSP
jgi:hypothetical protein